MPRRRKRIIQAKSLPIHALIVEELLRHPELNGYDMDVLEIHLKEKVPVRIQDVDKAIYNLTNYISKNNHLITYINNTPLVNKKTLAKMLNISRPTLDKWIANGFIKGREFHGDTTYPPEEILAQLNAYSRNV